MEFHMTTDLSVMQPNELAFNFEELHAFLSEQTAKYRNILVTEDGIAEAKKDRANLRKLADALNSEKIAAKKAFMKPYEEFEAKVKQLIELCKVPANEIDAQIKAFEEAKKAEKRAELETHFLNAIGAAGEYVEFADIFDPKWLNATAPIETAKTLIEDICARYNEDVGVLNGLCEEVDTSTAYALSRAFKATRNLANVMRVKNEIDREMQLQAERKAAEEARKQAAEEHAKLQAESILAALELSDAVTPEPQNQPEEQSNANPEEETMEIAFKVYCTRKQLAALKNFLVTSGIQYGRA